MAGLVRPEGCLKFSSRFFALFEVPEHLHGSSNGVAGLSVRDAAKRCKVSPATVARALQELADAGLVDCMVKWSAPQRAGRLRLRI